MDIEQVKDGGTSRSTPVATPPNAIVFSSGVLTIAEMIRAGMLMNLIAMVILTLLAVMVVPAVFSS